MAQVFDLDRPATDKLVLLAVADHADHDGRRIYPSIAALALKASVDARTVQRVIRRAERDGILILVAEASQHQPREYRMDCGGRSREPRGDTVSPLAESSGDRPPPLDVPPSGDTAPPLVDHRGGTRPGRHTAGAAHDPIDQRSGVTLSAPRGGTVPPESKRTVTKKENRQRESRARATRTLLPDGFALTEPMAAEIRAAGCTDPAGAFGAFVDHHRAKANRFADWSATWRTWVRMHGRYGCPCDRSRPGPRAAARARTILSSPECPTAEEAWCLVRTHIRRRGESVALPSDTPAVVVRAVRLIGGLGTLARSSNESVDRSHFWRVYESVVAQASTVGRAAAG